MIKLMEYIRLKGIGQVRIPSRHAREIAVFTPSLFRLQATIEDKEAEHAEAISALQAKHSSEMQKNKALLAASEATNTDLQKEVCGGEGGREGRGEGG